MELAVLAAHEWLREPVRVVHEVEREPPLDAEVPLVREVLVLRGDLDDVLRLGIEVQVDLAADAAERAGRPHLLERALGARRAFLELLVDRARRADREAAPAELALGVEPGEAPGRDDARVPSAALERERRALHDLLRVAHAAVAEDARVRVVAHEPVPVRRTRRASRPGGRAAPRRRARWRGRGARSGGRRASRSSARRGASP